MADGWHELAWLVTPACALLLACLALVPLGCQVLARGVVFIDLAVAQVAACGTLAGQLLGSGADSHFHQHGQDHEHHPGSWHARPLHDTHLSATQASPGADESLWINAISLVAPDSASLLWPMLFAGSGALLVGWLARRAPRQREALIGLVYVAAASVALLMVTADPHGRERLDQLLAADVLWATWPAVLLLGLASLCTLLACVLVHRRTGRHQVWSDLLFYPLFAMVLSLAVPVLGLYLVFALLIGPALWHPSGRAPSVCVCMAMLACTIGLLLSWRFDRPSGACIAICLSLTGLARAWRPPTAT
ncbi:MAG: metal ABC transporter permease [Lautropia sp.]|nr:metal ABC transporter permease [Lautropia sp.]